MNLAEVVITVHQRLDELGISHAFGGALALQYVGDPRMTLDVDVNVFVTPERVDEILDALAADGFSPERDRSEWLPGAGIRLTAAGALPFPVDIFPSLDDSYDEIERRIVRHPYGPDRVDLPFLSAEDLVVFKLSFGRSKDWTDLEGIALARPDLDVDQIEHQLIALRGPTMYPRIVRLRAMLREAAG